MAFKNNAGVEASAGTGKTTQMIQALFGGLKDEVFGIDEIAVITFAPDASNAMKTGIAIQLQNALDAGDEWAVQPLKNLSACSIGTIYSLCERILRERPVEAGIDPDFTVMDKTRQEEFFKTVYTNWLNERLETHYELFRKIFLKHDIPLKNSEKNNKDISLEDLIRTAMHHRELALFHPQKSEPVRKLLNQFIAECERLKENARYGALRKWMNQYINDLKVGLAATKKIPVIWNFSPGNKGGAASKKLRDQWKAVCWRYTEQLNYTINYPEIQRLYEKTDQMLANFCDYYRETLHLHGQLDREEIVCQTEHLLANRKEVREYFKNRFAHLFIDGFEDAEPLQMRILFYLAEKKEETAETWEAVNFEPGKLYVVSDPLQSVGCSQRADIEIYSAAMALITGGAPEHPAINYRSSEPLIRQLNRFFKDRIISPAAKNCQPSYIPTAPYQKSKSDGAIICVELVIKSATMQSQNRKAARETEAQLTAAWIKKTVERGKYSYADFLVLFRRNTNIHRTAACLETLQIPYQMIGVRSHFLHREICDMANLLNALANPLDKVSIIATLKGPFFSLSDRELYTWKLQKNEFDYRCADEKTDHVVGCALNELKSLHIKSSHVQAGVLIQKLLTAKNILASYKASYQGRQKLVNLIKTIEILKNFGKTPFCDIAGAFDKSVSGPSAMSAFSPCTGQTDVVRLMTIRQAKGLESKIVYLADSTSPNICANDLFINNRQERIIYKLADYERPEFKYWQAVDHLRNEAEAERLRYVAATRAKKLLVINKIPFKGADKTFAAPFWDADSIKTEKKVLSDLEFVIGKPEPVPQPRNLSRMKIEWEYIRKSLTHAIAKTAVPSIQIANPSTAFSPNNERHSKVLCPMNTPDIPCKLDSGASIGSMANKLLANHSADLATSAKTLIADTGSKIDRCVLIKIVNNLKKKALQKRIDNAGTVLRDIPLKFQHHDGIFYDGMIDLLFKEDDGWVLVDFQAIRVNRKCNINKVNQEYERQMSIYTEGLRKIGINVKESVLASD